MGIEKHALLKIFWETRSKQNLKSDVKFLLQNHLKEVCIKATISTSLELAEKSLCPNINIDRQQHIKVRISGVFRTKCLS